MHYNSPKSQQGFTLIELSIVLVIIGLIVGGVLVGQDLIKAAETRAAISQIEKYEAAANTFRTKYNGLPGDIPSPGNFGLLSTGVSGNGNGILNRTADDANDYDSESAAFFIHLAGANLISETVSGADATKSNVDTFTDYMPASKLGKGAMVAAYGSGGINYYIIGVPTLANGDLSYTANAEIAVIDAYNIDTKLDDSVPNAGKVQAITDLVTVDAGNAGAADNHCVNTSTTPDAYQVNTSARAADTECTVRIKASF